MLSASCKRIISLACLAITLDSRFAIGADQQDNVGVRNFLRTYLYRYGQADSDARYAIAKVPANKKGSSILVYLDGDSWCGSGGCGMLVLEPAGTTFKVIGRFTLVHLPVQILPSHTNGWSDFEIPVSGGGIKPFPAWLKFDGRRYPGNPSKAPRVPKSLEGKGTKIVFPQSRPLF